MKTLPNFRLRASAAGELMTNPTGKSYAEQILDLYSAISSAEKRISEAKNKEAKTFVELRDVKIPEYKKRIEELKPFKDKVEISNTSKSYIQDWAKEQIYGIKKQIKSKYIDKGLQLEDTAIDKTIEWLDISFAMKNEKYFENEFFTGTPDLIVDGVVYDTKCSWDAFSFPLFNKEIPTSDYFYQLQVYMHLTGCKSAKLVYVLLNTPEQMVYEIQHTYDHLGKELRIKTFDVEYHPDVIEELEKRVKNAREYLSTLNY